MSEHSRDCDVCEVRPRSNEHRMGQGPGAVRYMISLNTGRASEPTRSIKLPRERWYYVLTRWNLEVTVRSFFGNYVVFRFSLLRGALSLSGEVQFLTQPGGRLRG